MNIDIFKFQKASFEKNRLTIQETTSVDEWKLMGQALKQVEGSVQFWIGDWARHGEKYLGKYTDPKVYDELEEITGLKRNTIQEYKSVAEATSCVRTQDLDYSHHRVVASLPEDQQREFLNQAVERKLSVKDLKSLVNGPAVEEVEYEEVPETLIETPGLDRCEEIIKEVNLMRPSERMRIKQGIK